jgi:hypothetical protein
MPSTPVVALNASWSLPFRIGAPNDVQSSPGAGAGRSHCTTSWTSCPGRARKILPLFVPPDPDQNATVPEAVLHSHVRTEDRVQREWGQVFVAGPPPEPFPGTSPIAAGIVEDTMEHDPPTGRRRRKSGGVQRGPDAIGPRRSQPYGGDLLQ